MAEDVVYDRRCFGCGELNEAGLGLKFERDAEGWSSVETAMDGRYQSWRGVVHGGMISLLLDEAVGWAAWHEGHPAVTGRLEVRLRQPVRVGERIRIAGKVDEVRGRLIRARARVERVADGKLLAEATSSLMATGAQVE